MKVRDAEKWKKPPEVTKNQRKKPPRTTNNMFEAMGLADMEPNYQHQSVLRRIKQEEAPLEQPHFTEESSIFEMMGFPQFDPDEDRRERGLAKRSGRLSQSRKLEKSIFSLMGLSHLDPDFHRHQGTPGEKRDL